MIVISQGSFPSCLAWSFCVALLLVVKRAGVGLMRGGHGRRPDQDLPFGATLYRMKLVA